MEQTVVRIRTLEIGSGMPKICVPVVGKTEKEILEGAERAKAAKPDLVEFRVDWYEEVADSKKVVALLEKLHLSFDMLRRLRQLLRLPCCFGR